MVQAISQEQHLLVPADQDEEDIDLSCSSLTEGDDELAPSRTNTEDIQLLLQSLPRNLHTDKQKAAAEATAEATGLSSDLSLMALAEEDEGEEDQADAGLTIAWQYKASVQRERMGQSAKATKTTSSTKSADIYCHSYDLQGRLEDQVQVTGSMPVIAPCSCSPSSACSSRQCGFSYFRKLIGEVNALLEKTPRRVVRLLLYHPQPATLQVALPLLLAQIRTHRLPVVVLIAVQPWIGTTGQTEPEAFLVRRASDVVLAAESFTSRSEYPPPPEFRLFHGLLHVHKASTFTAATAHGGGHFADTTVNKRPAADLYGLKRDRRKLHIDLLHIPPEDYAQGGGSVGGGVRSGAGRPKEKSSGGLGCASGGGSSPLDF